MIKEDFNIKPVCEEVSKKSTKNVNTVFALRNKGK
jgi:hypothetical protein